MGSVISPIRQEAGGTTKRLSDCEARLSYDGVDYLLSSACCSVRRQHWRLTARFRNRGGQQDRFCCGTTHSTARKIDTGSMAMRSLAGPLKKCRAEFLGEFSEQLADSVRSA